MSRPHLFGPASSAFARDHLTALRAGSACLAFGCDPGVDVVLGPDLTWRDLAAASPTGRLPEFLTLWLPYQVIPPAIWDAPVPIIGLAADWNLLGHTYRSIRLPP